MCLGIPGMIVETWNAEGLPMGMVDFGGARREVCLAYVADDARAGDYVIVHVGFAISRVDPQEAQRTFQLLEEMRELEAFGPVHAEAPGNAGSPPPDTDP